MKLNHFVKGVVNWKFSKAWKMNLNHIVKGVVNWKFSKAGTWTIHIGIVASPLAKNTWKNYTFIFIKDLTSCYKLQCNNFLARF